MDVIIEWYNSYKSVTEVASIITKVFIPVEIKIIPLKSTFDVQGYRIDLKECSFYTTDELFSKLKENKLYMSNITEFNIKYTEEEKKLLEKSIVADEI